MSSIKVKSAAAIILLVVSILLSELLALLGFSVWHLGVRQISLQEFSGILLAHYNKIYKSEDYTSIGDYDPLTQMQFASNFLAYKSWRTNEFGFVSNDSGISELNEFPTKDIETFRVVMLGGSSTFGVGVDLKSETIAAKLESFANATTNYKNSKFKRIQVLNFGHPSAHSSISLAKLSQYLVHIDPDLVINFDGYNDAWYALYEANRVGTNVGIINWAHASYRYFKCLKYDGCSGNKFGPIVYILPYTTSLINSMMEKLNVGFGFMKIIKDYPPYKLSKFIHAKEGGFADALPTNYAASAGLACAKDFGFLGILQPHAVENMLVLTNSERQKMKNWEEIYGRYTNNLEGLISGMNKIYTQYEQLLSRLEVKFLRCPRVKFVSYRKLFDYPRNEDIYVDHIHYTAIGNEKIAKALAPLIQEQLQIE